MCFGLNTHSTSSQIDKTEQLLIVIKGDRTFHWGDWIREFL